jgi:hypothetical protein
MLRRAQIQSDNVSSLGFKIRVIGREIALASMRLQSMLSPLCRMPDYAACIWDSNSPLAILWVWS